MSQGQEREGRPFGQARFLWGFPCTEPGPGPKPLPIPQAQKAWVSSGGGTATQVPRSSAPGASQAHGRWCLGKAKVLEAGGIGGRWVPGPGGAKQGPGHSDVCMYAGVYSPDRACRPKTHTGRHTAIPPTPCSKNESGAASAGGATTTAPKPGPQILSTLSEQLGSENTKGFRPRPARHCLPPSQACH